ncbi:MAG: hypothetical protein ISN28_13420 [Ectothiorhodospiraceae bacterium AqS1]|nr:hypothetical protein [Ectothiorhodospiraceae bacterium AqS1]
MTVTGADDDDGRKDTATIRLTATGADYGGAATKDVSVEVIDSETPSMEVSPDDLDVEEGSNATFTVKLATEPSDPVTVNLAQSGTTVSEVTFDTQLTFTTSNWDTAQTVTVAAAADTNTDDESVTTWT